MGARTVLRVLQTCWRGPGGVVARMSPQGAPAHSWEWGRSSAISQGAILSAISQGTLRCGWEAALLSSPVSHLTAGLRQPGPPWCKGNEDLEAPLGLAFHGNCIDRRPPVLGIRCLRMWAPIHLRCQCQEVKLLWQKMGAGAFIDRIPACSFPS